MQSCAVFPFDDASFTADDLNGIETTPAMIAPMGITFQSLWYTNIRRNLPR